MTRLHEATPFIIAECGSNWHNLTDCLNSITAAKHAGADAVKFQAFDDMALYGFVPWDKGSALYNLPLEWLPALKLKAAAVGIELMCTAFSPDLVRAVDPFVEVHKVASSCLCDPFILKAVKDTGKPVLLSTGASNLGDIRMAVDFMQGVDLTLMYCNAAYPSREHKLHNLRLLREAFPEIGIGYSDHSIDLYETPDTAVHFYHASVLEKHFTAIEGVTPDSEHSLNADQFGRMVKCLRGDIPLEYQPSSEESPMFLRHNSRLIATRDIAPGDVLRIHENFGCHRSLKDDTRGMIGFAWEMLNGKVAKSPVAQGDGICLSDVIS